MPRLARLLAVTWLTVLAGCGAVLERAGVQRDFAAQFGCQPEALTRLGSGFRVQGCGRVATYACIDTHDEWRGRDVRFGKGRFMGALLGAMLEDSMHADQCFLTYAERTEDASRVVAGLPATVHRSTRHDNTKVLKARTPIVGGSVTLIAKPERHPEHVLVVVHSIRRLAASPCSASLFDDGSGVSIEGVQRAGDYDAHLLLRADALQEAGQAVRFAGSVCDFDFELDAASKNTLLLFTARLGEERARMEAKLAHNPDVSP